MQLSDSVKYFSTETFTDAFDSSVTFKGLINPFSEVANSGASSQRRILDTTTDVVIPSGRVVISPSGEIFIVAAANHDYWKGSVLRHKYPLLPVTILGAAGDIGESITDTQSDLLVYCYPYFVRCELNEEERSDYLSGFELYFSQVKSYARGSIVKLGTEYYRLKTDTWIDGAGFAVSQAVKLEAPIQTFDLKVGRGTYNATTDAYGETTVAGIECFVEPLRQDYEFVTPSFNEIDVGDKAITVLKADATMAVNDLIGTYRVLSVRDNGTWVTCQCRSLS